MFDFGEENQKKTETIENGGPDCKWENGGEVRFSKEGLSDDSCLTITAYDDDAVSDDLIGGIETTIGELLKNNFAEIEYPPGLVTREQSDFVYACAHGLCILLFFLSYSGEVYGGDFAGKIFMDCKFDEVSQEYVFHVKEVDD